MSIHLDPVIQEKLTAFAARRRRLIVIRGVFAALAMLLLTMLIIAAIDLQVRMPDWLRWTLSGTAYFTVLVIAWRQSLTWLLHAPDSRQLARLIEHAEPRLREDLLSAVELGRTEGAVFDSEQFRLLLQDDVAGRMERMEMSRLLPVRLVRRYIGYTFVVLCILGAMVAATGWQFPALLLRALWPAANLDRISRTKVMVVEPEGGNKLVPQGDTVRVLVVLGGERAGKAAIITETGKDGWQAADMEPLGGDRFAATIHVGRENVRYRIEAGDAVTRYYVLDARERPYITSFEKTYRYPKYSRIPDRVVTETDGAIAGLDGTEVDLVLKPNQPAKTAELRLEQGKKSSVIPLSQTADGRLSARIPLNASGTYRVHLVSAETGFENKFSPENEMRSEPDLVPAMELESPKSDLILPDNELLDLVGNASDDLGLALIARMLKVNDGPWRETVIQKDGLGKKQRIEHRWDLYEQRAKAGDLIVAKLVAVDLKGNRGESRPLQITVAAAGLELRRLQALELLRSLNLTTQALAESIDALPKLGAAVHGSFQKAADSDERRLLLAAYATLLTGIEAKFSECTGALGAAMKDASQGHGSASLVMVGRGLSAIGEGTCSDVKVSLDFLSANPNSPGAKNLASSVSGMSGSIHRNARLVAAAMEAITTAEEVAVLYENSQVIAREQLRLVDLASTSGDDLKKWEPLASRLRMSATHVRSLEELMEPMQKRTNSGARDRAKQMIAEISKRRVRLETAMLSEPSQRMLMQPLMENLQGVRTASQQFANWNRELERKPSEFSDQILQEIGPTYSHVGKAQDEMRSLKLRSGGDESMISAFAQQRLASRGGLIKAHGDLEELRPDADNQFVGDLRTATVAMDAVRQIYAGGDKAVIESRFSEMDRSLRILESGHNLLEAFDVLVFMASNERWEIRKFSAKTQAPQDWRWIERRLHGIPNELARARNWFDQRAEAEGPVRTAFEGVQKILWDVGNSEDWRAVLQEMDQRSNFDRLPVSAKAGVEVIAGQVKMALDLLRPHMDEARKRLEKLSPTISELAAAIAKEQDELKKETEAQAKAEVKPAEAAEKAVEKVAAQKQLNEKVEALKDLIRAEANKQDILKAEEREAMRDADDALAMLKDPPPKAEEALQDAVKDTGAQQKADLKRATEQQAKLQTALEQIAKHYDAAEKGKDLAETRDALREAEKELGIKQELEEKLAHAQSLAEMAQKDPTALLKELEAKLPDNPLMQKELSDISKDTLANAEQKLDQAAKQEAKVAANFAAQSKDPQAKNPAETAVEAAKQAQVAAQAAHEAAKTAEKSADTANNEAAKKLADKAAEAAKDAANEAGKAAEAAEKMAATSNPKEAAQSAQRTAEKAAKAAEKANEAAALAQQAQAASKQAEQIGGDKKADNAEAAKQSGEATAQAKKAAEAAQKAASLAQQAAKEQQATAQNSQNPQSQQASKAAEQAAQSAEKAAQAAQKAQKAAESAEAQANYAGNPEAAKQADTAGNEAAQAARAAKEAGAHAKEAAASGEPQKAALAAENAAKKAGEAALAAEKAAGAAEQAQNNSQQAAQNGGEKQGENQQAAQQSGEAKQQAQEAAQAAKQAQAQAQQAANTAKQAAAQQRQQIAQAAQQQQAIAQNAQEAGQEVARAARHEMRLGNQNGEQLAQLGKEIQETAQNEVPAAQSALQNAGKEADVNAAVQNAASELGSELGQLKSAQQGSSQSRQGEAQIGEPQAGQPSSPAEQQAMARALDTLDQQKNAQSQSQSAGQQASHSSPSSQSSQPSQSSSSQSQQSGSQSAAQSVLAQASQAAQASMRQSRAQQGMAQTPGSIVSRSQSEKSQGGAQANAGGIDYKLSTSAERLKKGDWGKLPKQLAEQLTKGQQEAIAGDYRQAVETYYKVIAEKAKEQKK